MKIVDLRSDTVTLPTEAMMKAMNNAPLGDDVYGEDPTVIVLQELAADMLGKEAALFVPSGTMGNLVSVLAHCERGDEAIMGTLGHTFLFEAGGISALGGVFPHTLNNLPDGTIALEDIIAGIRPDDYHHPISRLVILENSHNRCGGMPISREYTGEVAKIAHDHQMKLHIDGARIFNTAVALKIDAKDLVADADSITFCLSKGLCAPVGSVICGENDFIAKARRLRKQLGGGMRQAGIIAAAGVVALQTMISRLAEDHQRANFLASSLAEIDGLRIDYNPPSTNMIYVTLEGGVALSANAFLTALNQLGVKVGKVGKHQFRLVTHYWISDADVEQCVNAFKTVIQQA